MLRNINPPSTGNWKVVLLRLIFFLKFELLKLFWGLLIRIRTSVVNNKFISSQRRPGIFKFGFLTDRRMITVALIISRAK